jgi:protein subunit release factor A
MSLNRINFAVRITHIPTGEMACVDSTTARNMPQAKRQAESLLHARVWAAQNGMKRPCAEIATYDLPDDVQWPSDLYEYRQDTPNV